MKQSSFKGIVYHSWHILSCAILILLIYSCAEDKPVKQPDSLENGVLLELNSSLEKDSLNDRLWFERGSYYYEDQDYDKAIGDLNKAIELEPNVPQYYHLLSDVYMDYYRSRDALEVMEKAGELFPERIPTQLKLSETQFILRQYEPSLFTIAKIFTLEPQNAEAYFMMGLNFRALDQIDRAVNAFQTATELNPELTDAWLILGKIYEDRNDPLAIDYYEAAINVDPSMPETWHSKAFYLQNEGRLDEAIEIYKKINTIDRYYMDAYLNAGILYMEMDSFQKAWDQFNIMANLQSQNHLAWYYRGLANKEMGKKEAAMGDFETTLRLKPDFNKARDVMKELKG